MVEFISVLVVMTAISVVYFVTDKSSRVPMRLVSSAHGLLGAVLFGSAFVIASADRASRSLEGPYACLFIVPAISILLSFVFYRGNKLVHLLQVLNVPCLFWALFVGGMAIGADPI